MMEIMVVDSIGKLLSHKEEWESILEETDNDDVFVEPDWIISWWNSFGNKHDMLVLLVVNDNEVVGLCPLMATSKGICREISFIGIRESDKTDIVIKDKYRSEALKCIFDFLNNLEGKNIIRFDRMPEKSSNYCLLRTYFDVNHVPSVTIGLVKYSCNTKASDFKAYYEGRFSKKTRETINNKEKKLKRLGKFSYTRVSPAELDKVFAVHDKRWMRKIGNSSFSKGETKEFFKKLTSNKGKRFKVVVDAITINGRIISFMFGYEYNNKYLFTRIAHDDDFFFLSPGEIVLKKKLEECFLSQINSMDFGTGNEPYKAKWTDDYERVSKIVFPSGNLQSKLVFYLKYFIELKLINTLKRNPLIYNIKKHFLGKLKLLLSKEYISNRVAGIKREIGKKGLAVYLINPLNKIWSKLFSCQQYVLIEERHELAVVTPRGLKTREAKLDDVELLSEAMNESPSNIIRRFVSRHKCYITINNEEIIHYCWIKESSLKTSGKEKNIPIQNIGLHIYDAYMKKSYRNEHEYTYILSYILAQLNKEGCENCYITLGKCSKALENRVYDKIFHTKQKITEKRLFGLTRQTISVME